MGLLVCLELPRKVFWFNKKCRLQKMTLANFDIGNVLSNIFDLKIVVVKIPTEDFCSGKYIVDVVAL